MIERLEKYGFNNQLTLTISSKTIAAKIKLARHDVKVAQIRKDTLQI